MYHVVEFVDVESRKKSIDVVPMEWVRRGKCAWPPYKHQRLIQAAIINREQPDRASWKEHSIMILCSCGKPPF